MLRKSHTRMRTIHRLAKLLPTLSLAVTCTATAAEAEWQLAKDEAGIQLYTRSVANSPFPAIKVTALIAAPIEKVARMLGDGNGCGEWRAMCKSSEVLSVVSDSERYVYLVLDLPWPLEDRDMVIRSMAHVDADNRTVTVQLESASSTHPVPGYVRAESNGQYQIKALGDAQVEFTYMLHTDIGGDLSADLINPRMVASTFEDVQRLRVLAEK